MSSQAMIRPGKPHDLYYADEDNLARQAIPTTVNTRYRVVLTNLSQGTSVLTIPPNAGCSQLILVLQYTASQLAAQNGVNALPQSWGYQAVRQISYRIGSSTQFFMSGSQLLQRAMRQCKTQSQRQSILQLGGNAAFNAPGGAGTGDFGVSQYAYVALPIWSPPATDEFNPMLATDLLSSQLQITVELNPPSQFWIANPNAGNGTTPAAPALPTSFSKGYLQVEQVEPDNRGDLLANRVDMDKSMYVQPLQSWDQQEFLISVTRSATPAGGDINDYPTPVNLTGFRSGSCNNIILYLTNNDEQAAGASVTSFTKWYSPVRVTMSYAGLIYADYQDNTAAIFNLVDSTSPAVVATAVLTPLNTAATPFFSAASAPMAWCNTPFAQPAGSDFTVDTLVEGKEIQNGIVNLLISPPTKDSAGNALSANFTLHAVYSYNAAIAYSRGTAEILF